jgi:hypothetical protein
MRTYCEVTFMGMKLRVDGKEIPLKEFVEKIVRGSIVGAVTSLKGIKEDWEKIEVEISS